MSVQKIKPCSHYELWEQWKDNGDVEAKKQLIEIHLPIVEFVANKLAAGLPRNVSKDDLSSHGVMGLIDAIEKFDYQRGLQFETYASWRVRELFWTDCGREIGCRVRCGRRRRKSKKPTSSLNSGICGPYRTVK